MFRARSLAPIVSLALAVVVFAACGSPPPPKPPESKAIATATAPAPPPPPDTTAVPEPPGLVVTGRVAKPDALVKTVLGWTHLPLPGGKELVRSITDDAVADAVDLGQPIDAAVTFKEGHHSPIVHMAIAVAVSSYDQAKATLTTRHPATAGANGQIWIEGIGEPPDALRDHDHDRARDHGRGHGDADADDDDDETAGCMLAPAPSGARLVCGEKSAVEELAPYLARTASRAPSTSDVHVEIRPAPLRALAADLRGAIPGLAAGLLGGGSAIQEIVGAATTEASDFLDDAALVAFDATVADAGADVTMRVDYQSTKSFLAKLGTAHPERVDAPPAAFFHLPVETDLALYTRGTDAPLFDHARQILGDLMAKVGESGGMGAAESTTLRGLVADRMFPLLADAIVYGKGYDAAALDKAKAAYDGVKGGDRAAADAAETKLGEQVIGWHLVQVSEPIAKIGPLLKDWSALWNRPAFAKWARSKSSPKMVARMRVAPLPTAPGVKLPKDTVHLEITVPRADLEERAPAPPHPPLRPGQKPPPPPPVKKIPRAPIVLHFLAVPDQGATWIGFGLDGKLLATKAASALSSAPSDATLLRSADAPSFKDLKSSGALFVTIRGLLVFTAMGEHRSPYDGVRALDHKGQTPIVLTWTAAKPSEKAAGGSAISTFKLPRAAIEDIVKLAMSSMR